jgi:hypothetical protein
MVQDGLINHVRRGRSPLGKEEAMPKKPSSAPKSPPKFRSADTGKYVTPKFAKTHPKTTVKESK